MNGTLTNGFEFDIDERILSDWGFIEAVGLTESDDEGERIRGTVEVAKVLFGTKQLAKLKKHIKDRNEGFCPITEMSACVAEALTSIKKLKN